MSPYPRTSTIDDLSVMSGSVQDQAKNWVIHLATGGATKQDLRALEDWRMLSLEHAEAYAEASRLWQALGSPLEEMVPWQRLRNAGRSHETSRPIGRRAFLGSALAASVAGLGVMAVRPPFDLWPPFSALTADYHTGAGEQRQIALSNDATVRMNTRTSLNIERGGRWGTGIELLVGETAVAAGPTTFTVLAAEGRTSATSAQFNVRCNGATVEVTCLSGRVDVEYRGEAVTIRSREQVAYAGERLGATRQIDPEVVAGWRDGILVFENERLSQVIDEVNRYRAGRIILVNAELGDRRITARFKLARLDALLTQFQAVFGAKVTSLPGGFVLLG